MRFLSNQAHRHYCGAYFQVRVLAHIDHTFVSIASLFDAIKFIFLKTKSYALNRFSFSLNYIDYIIKKKSLLCFTSLKMRKDGKGWGGRVTPSSLYFYVKLNFSLFYEIPIYNTNISLKED